MKDKFEIVFLSADNEEEAMKGYYKEMGEAGGDWLAMPWGRRSAIEDLGGCFKVDGFPTFLHLVWIAKAGV